MLLTHMYDRNFLKKSFEVRIESPTPGSNVCVPHTLEKTSFSWSNFAVIFVKTTKILTETVNRMPITKFEICRLEVKKCSEYYVVAPFHTSQNALRVRNFS